MIDLIQEMLSRPETSGVVEKFSRLASLLAKCQNCTIFAITGKKVVILHKSGYFPQQISEHALGNMLSIFDFSSYFEVNDVKTDPRSSSVLDIFKNLGTSFLAGFPLGAQAGPQSEMVGVLCCDAEPHKPSVLREVRLLELAALAGPALNLIGLQQGWSSARLRGTPADRVAQPSLFGERWATMQSGFEAEELVETGQNIVARFLMETLPLKPRMISRNRIRYFAVRAWRAPIKKYQIEALKSVKADASDVLVNDIANDLMETILDVHGIAANCAVTPVPCGHSGPNCLSCKIAERLAAKLGADFIEAFDPIAVKGSSHPITNVRRPKMKLRMALDRPVILVDDVATSGSHIAEAAALLKRTSPNVWPVVWIGG